MELLPILKLKVKDALPLTFATFSADLMPPLILYARCSTWLTWVTERLEIERYGGVATRPAHSLDDPLLTLQDDRHIVMFANENGDALVKRLTELGTIANLQANTKRQLIVRNLHRFPIHLQPRLKYAIDICQRKCTLVFTSNTLLNVHPVLQSRCGLLNCNPPKDTWPMLMSSLGSFSDETIRKVIADPRSDSIIAAVLLLEHYAVFHEMPCDVISDFCQNVISKLMAKNTHMSLAQTIVRQMSKFVCQYKLSVTDMIMAITRNQRAPVAAVVPELIRMSTNLSQDITQRHTLVACETFLWNCYALGQGLEPVL